MTMSPHGQRRIRPVLVDFSLTLPQEAVVVDAPSIGGKPLVTVRRAG